MFKKILFMIPIMGFIMTWSGSSVAFEPSHYSIHKKKFYAPCIYIYDDNGIRFAVNAYFQQLGASKNFRLERHTRIENPDEDCPEIEFPVTLPVEEDEDAVQLPVEDEGEDEHEEVPEHGDEGEHGPEGEHGDIPELPENAINVCPNEKANDRAKQNREGCGD